MDIGEAYEELKILIPEGYISVGYVWNRFSSGDEEKECSIYVEDVVNLVASTFEEVLDQAKKQIKSGETI